MNHFYKIIIFTFRLVVIVSVVRHTVNMAVTAPPQNVQLSVVEMQPEHVEEHGGTSSTMSEVTHTVTLTSVWSLQYSTLHVFVNMSEF